MLRLLLLKIYILSLENINLIKISQSLHCGFRICDVTNDLQNLDCYQFQKISII